MNRVACFLEILHLGQNPWIWGYTRLQLLQIQTL